MLEESFGDRVYRTRIGKTIRFAEAPVQGMSVIRYDPGGQAARWYRQLAREVAVGSSTSAWRCRAAAGGGGVSTRGGRPSMREGPLSELFRNTDAARPAPSAAARARIAGPGPPTLTNYVAVIRVVGRGRRRAATRSTA